MTKNDNITKQPCAAPRAARGRAASRQQTQALKGTAASACASDTIPSALPRVGKSRWQQLKGFVPVSRETWRKLVREGRAPQPERISDRCTVYDNGEMHRWFADPANYRA